VVVDALNGRAKEFYLHYHFEESLDVGQGESNSRQTGLSGILPLFSEPIVYLQLSVVASAQSYDGRAPVRQHHQTP
jgi:hypothetical protein